MDSVELKISIKDWLYIVLIGAFFGFFISLILYFLSDSFKVINTIYFGVLNAIIITLFSSVLITISNNYVLPYVNKRFWYLISFTFSFFSGAFGFIFSFYLLNIFNSPIPELLQPYFWYITLSIGCLTFLIGLVLHQFISMKYKNESIKNEILNSKIKAFENELNPHFLFNALNSMSELVYTDPSKAEESILNLAQFLRNVIKKDSLILLDDELSMVETYLEIEKIRFDDKIELNIKKHTSIDSIKVPKFSIQLLVENAIKHGFYGKNLKINIDIYKDKIIVSNNGAKITNFSFGTGLSNLQSRLKLLNIGRVEYESSLKLLDDKIAFIIYLNGEKSEDISS